MANPNRLDNISELFNTKQMKLRGKAKQGFIRPTVAEFFTSKDFEDIIKELTLIGYTSNRCSTDGPAYFSDTIVTTSSVVNYLWVGIGAFTDYSPDPGDIYACWQSSNVATDQWITYDFGSLNKQRIEKIAMTSFLRPGYPGYEDYQPKDFLFQGSNDNIDFDTLGTFTGELWTAAGQTREFEITNTELYQYYRWYITLGGSDVYPMICMGHTEMYEGIYT
jgi:hypothetical protein